ncbi:MAG: alpha/beta fold hydrolase [Acidimicrobiales bacterium]|nr:MAG: alpha/beta fold hydrolase [Acidimicrobiales bacterium]
MPSDVSAVIEAHRQAGSFFEVAGIRSFVRAEGEGETVVLVHGLPASSFLYRKVIDELAARGFRALAFDLPGLGLADRPENFDYTLSGLGLFAAAAVDALGIDRFHLVVHDAGGPIGFEAASHLLDRVQSLTVLNTIPELDSTPFPGEFLARFTRRVGGPMSSAAVWRTMMYRVGILDRSAVPEVEVDAYRDLALGPDDGAAYLQIMRGLHATRGETKNYRPLLHVDSAPYPVQIVWGAKDPILTMRRFGWRTLEATGLPSMSIVPARHFLQEDQAPAISALIASHAQRASA